MLTKHLPAWGKAPIEQYLKTKNFKNHDVFPTSQDEMKEIADESKAMRDYFVSTDNTESDPDKRPGFVEGAMPWLGEFKGRYEKNDEQGTLHAVQHYGTESDSNEAIIYTKQTSESYEQIVVTREPNGADDGVSYYSLTNPNGSFMTLPPM